MVSRVWAAPLLVAQALWVAARARRLPEAGGPRDGVAGRGSELRLLILGDSSAAGVGVADQAQALAGQVVAALSVRCCVRWRLLARSGATVGRAAAMLDALGEERFDVALVALGVNDVKNGVRLAAFEAGYGALLEALRGRFGVGHVVISGVPPMGAFPILPSPLREVMGARAGRFDAVLRRLAEAGDASHLPMDFEMDASAMAEDGFHPGAAVYAQWGTRAAALIGARA